MKVSWNSDSFALYLQPVFNRLPSLQTELLQDFINYKGAGLYPDVFGKDGPYTQPGAIVASRVYHVHLMLSRTERQSSRIAYNRTSNRALVYTQHARYSDVYSLLAIFPDNAHTLANDPRVMRDIATYAKKFQDLEHP